MEFQINFSRPAGQVIAQYYDFIRLGREGYARIHGGSHSVAQYFGRAIEKYEAFDVIHDGNPQRGIPAVVWRIRNGCEPGFTLYDLADRLRMRGWQVPAYPLTGTLSETGFQRILVKRDFTREMADLLLDDIKAGVDYFKAHPTDKPVVKQQAQSFNHL